MTNQLFTPLGMSRSGFLFTPTVINQMAPSATGPFSFFFECFSPISLSLTSHTHAYTHPQMHTLVSPLLACTQLLTIWPSLLNFASLIRQLLWVCRLETSGVYLVIITLMVWLLLVLVDGPLFEHRTCGCIQWRDKCLDSLLRWPSQQVSFHAHTSQHSDSLQT